MSEIQHCGFDGFRLRFCAAMQRFAQRSGSGRKGVFIAETITAHHVVDFGLLMKGGSGQDVLLNVCPFCAKPVRRTMKDILELETAAAPDEPKGASL